MRRQIINLLAIAGILTACHSINSHSITGTYTNHAESPFSVADDTLLISKTGSDNIYAVTRKTGYYRIIKGKPDSLRHLSKKMTGTWDEQQQHLVILQTGSNFNFTANGNLFYGNSEYRKK